MARDNKKDEKKRQVPQRPDIISKNAKGPKADELRRQHKTLPTAKASSEDIAQTAAKLNPDHFTPDQAVRSATKIHSNPNVAVPRQQTAEMHQRMAAVQALHAGQRLNAKAFKPEQRALLGTSKFDYSEYSPAAIAQRDPSKRRALEQAGVLDPLPRSAYPENPHKISSAAATKKLNEADAKDAAGNYKVPTTNTMTEAEETGARERMAERDAKENSPEEQLRRASMARGSDAAYSYLFNRVQREHQQQMAAQDYQSKLWEAAMKGNPNVYREWLRRSRGGDGQGQQGPAGFKPGQDAEATGFEPPKPADKPDLAGLNAEGVMKPFSEDSWIYNPFDWNGAEDWNVPNMRKAMADKYGMTDLENIPDSNLPEVAKERLSQAFSQLKLASTNGGGTIENPLPVPDVFQHNPRAAQLPAQQYYETPFGAMLWDGAAWLDAGGNRFANDQVWGSPQSPGGQGAPSGTAYVGPSGETISPDDMAETMKAHGMTEEQVVKKLGLRPKG